MNKNGIVLLQILTQIGIFSLLIIPLSCNSLKQLKIRRQLNHSEIFTQQFTGFCLYDPLEKKILSEHNAQRYFTPASNTKILTTLACLETFGDSLPSLLYEFHGDSLIIQPFADPTFLNPRFKQQPAFDFLKSKKIYIKQIDSPLEPFGPGWAWDDFQYDFQPERSWFPIYGNTVRILRLKDSIEVIPDFFLPYTQINYGEKPGDYISRDIKYNLFNIWTENNYSIFEREIPFDYDQELLVRLLADTLQHDLSSIQTGPLLLPDTLFNQSTLQVLALMMQTSDNFLAEQLLIQAALYKGETNLDAFMISKLKEWSAFNPYPIKWFDGSGLSRYNLITPRSLVAVLGRIYQIIDFNTIKIIFPTGGESGTIKDWYAGSPPYVFAKSGTLKNIHNLSGYIQTKSGKILIFSMMNNNYVVTNNELKSEMDRLLRLIKKHY